MTRAPTAGVGKMATAPAATRIRRRQAWNRAKDPPPSLTRSRRERGKANHSSAPAACGPMSSSERTALIGGLRLEAAFRDESDRQRRQIADLVGDHHREIGDVGALEADVLAFFERLAQLGALLR